jgi:transcriptional regulator with XRE-family HTH domain
VSKRSIHNAEYHRLIAILRGIREELGLTQVQLAQSLGTDQSYVSKYERRERRLDVIELRSICTALGTTLPQIVERLEGEILSAPQDQAVSEEGTQPETFADYPALDNDWDSTNWFGLLEWLVDSGLVDWEEVGALVLGHLNPSQVGTSIASKTTFQQHFPPRKTWENVRQWHFNQLGKCVDCGTRLELQADHMTPREELGDAADTLPNMTLRCRRCNVIRRPSHKQGGQTYLTAEAALMWILFVRRPKTYQEFEKLCREYGMTMANIRFQESWAMARWLAREGLYAIDPSSQF